VAIHAVRVPNPYQMVTDFTFDGITPFADAYKSRPSDAPDAQDSALTNAPRQARSFAAACIGRPTATRSQPSCYWTRRRAIT
jgi:hypothetical protein